MRITKTRAIGRDSVSAIGMGCMGISHAEGKALPMEEAVSLIREAYETGYTLFDTGINYGYAGDPHHNEKVLGQALKGIREKIFLVDKCGVDFDYAADPDRPPLLYDSKPESIRRNVESSLKRLQTDYIDLYIQSRIDPGVEPEVVADTYGQLIREGKIRYWGVSEAPLSYLKRANAVTKMTAVEYYYNILTREHEDLMPFLEENQIAWLASTPMNKGLLTATAKKGTVYAKDDWRSSKLSDEILDENAKLIAYLITLSTEKQATAGQISLAWILGRRPYIIPIPGMRKKERLSENLEAANVSLTAEEIQQIDMLAKKA